MKKISIVSFCLLLPLFVYSGCSCTEHKRPEITWSLMHPTVLDTLYMERVIREAEGHPVDNFEICGKCNGFTDGSLDGLLMFEEYPLAMAAQNKVTVEHNQKCMKRIVEMCHEAGKKVFYWHREVLCNEGMVKSVPALLDENGEFDLLGDAYEQFLRYKIRKAFEIVPELDGIVLTLTEASFSTIHNSRPDVYPPEKVVEKIAGVFAEELSARGKRFILRSFGSISADYESIIKGAEFLSGKYSFEIETKITPYDFSPFLPDNPFLKTIQGCTLGAECDCLGEFLGVGMLPAEDVEDIVRYVNYARKCKVNRFAIRLDRHCNNIFDTYPINLYAYEQAILHPGITAEGIREKYYRAHYTEEIASEMIEMSREGIDCVKKTMFIDGNVIFHQFPTSPVMRYIKSGGILAAFSSEGDLHQKTEQWGMLNGKEISGRPFILKEKEQALYLADKNLERLESLKPFLPEADYIRLKMSWGNARDEAESIGEYTKVICAYFDSMEENDPDGNALKSAMEHMKETLGQKEYLRPIQALSQLFADEYPLEFAARKALMDDPSVLDFVLPGGSFDQIRIEHYMHGVRPVVKDNRLGLVVGNKVFPNAYLEVEMKGSDDCVKLVLEGWGDCCVGINGQNHIANLNEMTEFVLEAAPSYTVTISKAPMRDFPTVTSINLIKFK